MKFNWSPTVTCLTPYLWALNWILRCESESIVHKLLVWRSLKIEFMVIPTSLWLQFPWVETCFKNIPWKIPEANNLCSESNTILSSSIKSHADPPHLTGGLPFWGCCLPGRHMARLLICSCIWDRQLSGVWTAISGLVLSVVSSTHCVSQNHITSDKGRLFYKYRRNKYSWILSTFLNEIGQHGGARKASNLY